MSNDGLTLELMEESRANLVKNLKKLEGRANAAAYAGLVKLAGQIAMLAQNKLKESHHIVTSRLRNSIFVKTPNGEQNKAYTDNKGHSYNWELSEALLSDLQVAVGTNVEYAESIEFGSRPHVIEVRNKKVLSNGTAFFGKKVNHPGFKGDSYLGWAAANADISRLARDISQDLLGFIS